MFFLKSLNNLHKTVRILGKELFCMMRDIITDQQLTYKKGFSGTQTSHFYSESYLTIFIPNN